MIVLGLNAFHGDASASLLKDGQIVAAAEEERFRRIKHWAGFPTQSIKWCLSEAGATLADVDHVAVNQDPSANLMRKVAYTLRTAPSMSMLIDRARNKRKRMDLPTLLEQELGAPFRGRLHSVEHHVAHLASAHFASPFDQSVVVSIDGFGDFASAAWGVGQGNQIDVRGRVLFPHSLGIFYQALTQYLGFPHYGDEYKVMGLAPYGEPKYIDEMRKIVRLESDGAFRLDVSFFRHHREKIPYQWDNGEPKVGTLFSDRLEAMLGPRRSLDSPLDQRHKDIARSVQAMYEEAFLHLIRRLHERTPLDALSLSGGCAMNSVANGKVLGMTPFKRLYVQAAAGDAGGALGAALYVWEQQKPASSLQRHLVMDHAYWGPSFSDEEVGRVITTRFKTHPQADCRFEFVSEDARLFSEAAELVSKGAVLGWFQGRMEWGPRALGNRSIVCDPRRSDMKDILNRKIKRRESFRPFAPSILREATAEWFETEDDVPFMMQVYKIRAEKRSTIPAVTHVDGTGRLQTVTRKANPRYYALIEQFHRLTDVPMVLNTSFNENEPVVCRPEEALDCFLRTRMDALVMGNWIIWRNG
jgi:carbamoyltransferase